MSAIYTTTGKKRNHLKRKQQTCRNSKKISISSIKYAEWIQNGNNEL